MKGRCGTSKNKYIGLLITALTVLMLLSGCSAQKGENNGDIILNSKDVTLAVMTDRNIRPCRAIYLS